MVELSTRKSKIRRVGGNHHEKLGLESILCANQLTNPDAADMSSDPAGYDTNTRFSKPNLGIRTPGFSLQLVLHDRSLFSLARDESGKARDGSRMARG
jgi:hypothetical protein